MAELLKNWTFTKPGGKRKYPWEEWFDGEPRRLIQGKDFEPTPKNFRAIACAEARRRGVVLRTNLDGADGVVLQAVVA